MTDSDKIQKSILLYVGLFLSIIYFSRLLFLSADVPNFILAQIQPIDEFYYNEIGIQIYRHGLGKIIDGSYSIPCVANARTFLIPNLLVGLSLKIFGNNFYGLKIPTVIMGFLSLLILYKCLKILLDNNKIYIFIGLVTFVLDFNVFCLSREAVTVIPCMLATSFFLRNLLNTNDMKFKFFILGLCPVLAFCLIYMYLTFLIIASFGYLLISILFEEKYRIRKLVYYGLGFSAGILICEICSLVFFQQHIVKTVGDVLFAHHRKIGGLSVFKGGLKFLVFSVVNIFLSNEFKYNYLILVLSFISIAISLYRIIIYRDEKSFILVLIFFCHWAQTIFLNNMTESKAAVTFPIVIAIVLYSLFNMEFDYLKNNMRLYTVFIMFSTIAIFFSLGIMFYHDQGTLNRVFYFKAKLLWRLLIVIGSISVFCFLIFDMDKKLLLTSYCITILFMASLSCDKILLNRTYHFKNMLTEVNLITQGCPVVNGMYVALYNLSESPTDFYDHYKGIGYDDDYFKVKLKEAVEKFDQLYLACYSNTSIENLNELISDTPYIFKQEKQFKRNFFYTYPGSHDSDYTLYKKTLREQ